MIYILETNEFIMERFSNNPQFYLLLDLCWEQKRLTLSNLHARRMLDNKIQMVESIYVHMKLHGKAWPHHPSLLFSVMAQCA